MTVEELIQTLQEQLHQGVIQPSHQVMVQATRNGPKKGCPPGEVIDAHPLTSDSVILNVKY